MQRTSSRTQTVASSSSQNRLDEKYGYRRFHLTMKKLERSNRDALVSVAKFVRGNIREGPRGGRRRDARAFVS